MMGALNIPEETKLPPFDRSWQNTLYIIEKSYSLSLVQMFFFLCLNCWKNRAELQAPQAVLFDKLALWRTISAPLIKVSCDFWAPDQKSADSSHGWLWCPYGQCTASGRKGNTSSLLRRRLCQTFSGIFCGGGGWCSSRFWIIEGVSFYQSRIL